MDRVLSVILGLLTQFLPPQVEVVPLAEGRGRKTILLRDPADDRACCSNEPSCGRLEAAETACDGVDNDCDGSTDEDLEPPAGACLDAGVCAGTLAACAGAAGWLCEYPEARYEPGTERACDGLDNDCDGEVDEGLGVGGACDPPGICGPGILECGPALVAHCSTGPGGSQGQAREERCNGQDDDCDGATDEDWPQLAAPCSALGECGVGTYECAPAGDVLRCSVEPGGSADSSLPETCDGLDEDCDGTPDEELEPPENLGCRTAGVCTLAEAVCLGALGWDCGYPATWEPGTERSCDDLDNDCDGQTDEGNPGGGRTCGVAQGACTTGAVTCVDGELVCLGEVTPGDEQCNGQDDDCDGQTDEGYVIGQRCPPAPGPDNPCIAGTWECNVDGSGRVCSTHAGGSDDRSHPEECNGLDDDCNSLIDDGLLVPADLCPDAGVCAGQVPECHGAGGWACPSPPTWEGLLEQTCDGLDNDCDGATDEDCDCEPGAMEFVSRSVGECAAHVRYCGWDGTWEPAWPELFPHPERCNGMDDDCDGAADEGLSCQGYHDCRWPGACA